MWRLPLDVSVVSGWVVPTRGGIPQHSTIIIMILWVVDEVHFVVFVSIFMFCERTF